MTDSDLIARIEARLVAYRYGLRLNTPKEELMIADIEALLPLARDGEKFRGAAMQMRPEPPFDLDDTKENEV